MMTRFTKENTFFPASVVKMPGARLEISRQKISDFHFWLTCFHVLPGHLATMLECRFERTTQGMEGVRYEWISGAAAAAAAAAAVGDEAASHGSNAPRVMIVFSTEDYRRLARCMGQEAARLNSMPRMALDIGSAAGHTTKVSVCTQTCPMNVLGIGALCVCIQCSCFL